MNILFKLLIITIALIFYLNNFMENISDRKLAIPHKIYLFLFIFIVQFLINFFTNVNDKETITLGQIIEDAVNNALLAVIAFDVYNDLVYLNYYKELNPHQQITILIFLIIGFMTAVKILQLLITSK